MLNTEYGKKEMVKDAVLKDNDLYNKAAGAVQAGLAAVAKKYEAVDRGENKTADRGTLSDGNRESVFYN